MRAPLQFSPLGDEPITITSPFGERVDPVSGKKAGHNGCDLHAPFGTTVYAPGDGVITAAYTADAGGMQLLLLLDSGWRCGFAHLSEFRVTKGERVAAGDEIALSGNSGAHTTGAHLHFTLLPPGGKDNVDPVPFLTGSDGGKGPLVAAALLGVGAKLMGWV